MDLLLHECNGDQHYSRIKNFCRLIRGQLSNHGHAIYCCKKCLHAYSTKDDYPLAPESLVIDRKMYSPTQQSVFPESIPQKKLTPNLRDKTRYAVHHRNLKLYVQLGLVITKVHRVLTFKQSPWLKAYIDFNTHHRSLSDNGFLRDLFKLMNNSVFGKTQENLRKRVQVDLITDAAVLCKRVAKPSFCHGIPITHCLTVVQCEVQTLELNRPIYVGFTVLELSKLHMYDFHYNHMKVKYPHADQLRLLFTDTDSLAYAVQTENIYEDMASDAATKYDFIEYPINHPLYDTSNRRAVGFFKDGLNSIPMKEFVGIRPKCYTFLCTGKVDRNTVQHSRPVEKKIAKGVKLKVKDEHYLDALHSFQTFVSKQNLISSTAHTVRTVHQ